MEFKNKKTLIVGLGVTGKAVLRFLMQKGASITVTDRGKESEMDVDISALRKKGIRVELGRHEIKTFTRADLIILSPGVPHTLTPVVTARENGVPVWGEVELASHFIQQPIIAVTGTNGKTTTTALLGKLLKNSGFKVFVGGNIGNPLINAVDDKEGAEIIVAEISSFQLDTIDTFRPAVAVLLNVSDDHLDRYPDFAAYVKSKNRIFKNQRKEDLAILNGSDPIVRAMGKQIKSKKWFFQNITPGSEKPVPGATINGKTIFFQTTTSDVNSMILSDILLVGRHNLENVTAASLAAMAFGVTLETIKTTLKEFKGLPHRLQFVTSHQGVSYFNDSKATNLDSVARALDSFNSPVVLIMGGRNKGSDFNILSGRIQKHIKKLIAMGEAKENIKSTLGNIVQTETALSMEEAVSRARGAASTGDIVLLSPGCSSFDMYSNFEERGEDFCKRVKNL
jgi:UDP-N-acetylmuramoylalanine--D-glutamate ligase